DSLRSDRPNVTINDQMSFSAHDVELGSGPSGFKSKMAALKGDFVAPVCTEVGGASCDGNEGRNTFRGPGLFETDLSLFKKIPLGSNESRYLQFRAETFNLFNRTNLGCGAQGVAVTGNLSSATHSSQRDLFEQREVGFK